MIPVANSVVYVRPLYTAASTNPQPQLAYVIAVLGKNVGFEKTLSGALSDVFNATVTVPTGGGTNSGTVPAAVAGILQQAQADYTNAQTALQAQDLAGYQADIAAMEQAIQQASQILGTPPPGTSTGTTTTTVPKVKEKTKTKSVGSGGTAGTSTTSSSTTTTSTTTSTQPSGGGTTTSTTVSSAAERS